MQLREKAELLRRLHQGPELLVLPNAWDAVSARLVEAAGYPAVATTSAGCAAVLGYPDGQQIPRSEMLFIVGKVAGAVNVPVTADVEAGYDSAVQTVRELIECGVVGMNLEDRARGELIPLERQFETIRAVRAAADRAGVPVVLNARTDIVLAQHGDAATRLDRAIERLNAFHEAGADCLFAPGVRDGPSIGRVAAAVRGPLNIIATIGTPPLDELKKLGVRRVSMGSGPSRVALGAFQRFLKSPDLAAFRDAVPSEELQRLMSRRADAAV